MFGLIRLIFILLILGVGYSWFKWKTTGESRWQRHFYVLGRGTILLAIGIVGVLVLTRIL